MVEHTILEKLSTKLESIGKNVVLKGMQREKAMMMVPNEILGGKNALKKRGQKLCQRRVN